MTLFGVLQAVGSVRAEARSIECKVHQRRWLSGKTGQTLVCVYSEWVQDAVMGLSWQALKGHRLIQSRE